MTRSVPSSFSLLPSQFLSKTYFLVKLSHCTFASDWDWDKFDIVFDITVLRFWIA